MKRRTATFYEACKFISGRTPVATDPTDPLEERVVFSDGTKVQCHNSRFNLFPEPPINSSGFDIQIENPTFTIYEPDGQGSSDE